MGSVWNGMRRVSGFFFSLLGGSGTLMARGGANETGGWVGFCDVRLLLL